MAHDPTRPPQVAFVGPSGSGKTTLIEAVIGALRANGLRVGFVKHTHHRLDFDTVGKDSWRIREAGAEPVLLATPERYLLQARREALREADLLFSGCDLVIHEGNRHSPYPKVVVGESPAEARQGGTEGPVIASVGAPAGDGIPAFARDDVDGVAGFLLAYARSQPAADADCLESMLDRATAAAGHLCPGQVLGARMTVRGLRELDVPVPPPPKRLMAFIETDGCVAEAVAAISGCSLGSRTLRHLDYGKTAVTLLDLTTGRAVRVKARDDARELAALFRPGEDAHAAQAEAYRQMPDEALLTVQPVRLRQEDLPRRPRARRDCAGCGEQVSAGREVLLGGRALCQACAAGAYYEIIEPAHIAT